ncbi:MAG: RNA polymerase sigma factor [Fuerstiella sp.]
MPSDAEIRERVEQACVEHESALRSFLQGLLRDEHLVDDAFQKSVIKALEAASQVNPGTIRGWLFQIALNEARQLKRSSSRQGKLEKAFWQSGLSATAGGEADGLACLLSKEKRQSVMNALQKLDDRHREVVIRRIQKDQTFAVIAEEMGKPLGTVLTWMRRALFELSEMSDVKPFSED